MQILESEPADKLTLLRIVFPVLYPKLISSNWIAGGAIGSTSGNLRITSVSFSTGFNSGLNAFEQVNFKNIPWVIVIVKLTIFLEI